MNTQEFADLIAHTCYEHYEKLPKTGKPVERKEWTLLASIVLTKDKENESSKSIKPYVVALATGSKCLGAKDLNLDGSVVNDSHAEILARRAFLRYLYNEMYSLLEGKKSMILSLNKAGFTVKSEIKFHLFISHTPCGDASIFLKENITSDDLINCPKDLQKRKCEVLSDELLHSKKLKKSDVKNNLSTCIMNDNITENKIDIYRTGAKCVVNGQQDLKGKGIKYHILGELRTKPGRGNPTLSMSCSDKIAKWNICGLQGALLSHLLHKPIYLSTVIIGRCPYSKEALYHAIIERTSGLNLFSENYHRSVPNLIQSDLQFKHSHERMKAECNLIKPSSSAIIWSEVTNKPLEVAVNGIRQGVTIKCQNKSLAKLSICKRALFQQFIDILEKFPTHTLYQQMRNKDLNTYYDYKMAAEEYQKCWTELKTQCFSGWTDKPKYLFCCK